MLGTVLPAGINALSVRYIPDDARNYSESTISVKLLVRERPKLLPELFWRNPVTDVPLIYPSQIASAMLCATITNNAKGMISYSPAAGAVLGAGTHELLAEFTPHDSKTCLPGSVTSTIVIVKGLPIVEWEIKEDTLEYGTPLTENQLNAKCKALQGAIYHSVAITAIISLLLFVILKCT